MRIGEPSAFGMLVEKSCCCCRNPTEGDKDNVDCSGDNDSRDGAGEPFGATAPVDTIANVGACMGAMLNTAAVLAVAASCVWLRAMPIVVIDGFNVGGTRADVDRDKRPP